MTEPGNGAGGPAIPSAVVEKKTRASLSAIWLVPVVAALIGLFLAWKTISERGPVIVISFETASGLEAGKTKVRYNDVEVGQVASIALTADRSQVEVTVQMVKESDAWLDERARFWVVRPVIRGGTVEGLGTLLSGAYIGMDLGGAARAGSEKRLSHFTGLELPPVVTSGLKGREFLLKSDILGSFGFGSPIYFRRLQVGQVVGYELDKDGRGVTTRIFINAPHDQYVTNQARFWETTGIDFSVSAEGLKLDTESLASIVIGGIAFQNRGDARDAKPAEPGTAFRLFKDRSTALAYVDTVVAPFALRYSQSVRGLTIGAPVDFRGVVVGEVRDIRAEFGESGEYVTMVVMVDIYPERLQRRTIASETARERGLENSMNRLVAGGLRAQLRTGSLLTGQLYVALDFFKSAPKASIAWNSEPPALPTIPGTLSELEDGIAEILAKLRKVPYDEIGRDLHKALKSLDQTLQTVDQMAKRVDQELTPEVKDALLHLRRSLQEAERVLAADSPLQQETREALGELTRAARSLRVLTDYLEQHPEALIRGKQEQQ